MAEAYSLLGVEPKDIVTLEKYLQDYFTNILKKLKDLKAQSKQTDIYFWKNAFLYLDMKNYVYWHVWYIVTLETDYATHSEFFYI